MSDDFTFRCIVCQDDNEFSSEATVQAHVRHRHPQLVVQIGASNVEDLYRPVDLVPLPGHIILDFVRDLAGCRGPEDFRAECEIAAGRLGWQF